MLAIRALRFSLTCSRESKIDSARTCYPQQALLARNSSRKPQRWLMAATLKL
jgi:hypothetical protein